jgi:hypothetical protein
LTKGELFHGFRLTRPAELTGLYDSLLTQLGITIEHRPHQRKWLRYHWDFCHKLRPGTEAARSFPLFDEKLRVKHPSDFQRHQAHHAVSLDYEWDLTDLAGGQRLRVPFNGSKNSPVDATGSVTPPAGAVTTASPVPPLIVRERSRRKDGKPLRSLHQSPPTAPSPQARKPLDLPRAALERPAQEGDCFRDDEFAWWVVVAESPDRRLGI